MISLIIDANFSLLLPVALTFPSILEQKTPATQSVNSFHNVPVYRRMVVKGEVTPRTKLSEFQRYLDPGGEGNVSIQEWQILDQLWKEHLALNLGVKGLLQGS